MNICLKFLFLNSIAGAFIFIILGIFVILDNPFLIIMNLKKIDGKKYEDKEKKNAYTQYFVSAGFNIFYAFMIWLLPKVINNFCNKKQKRKQINKEQINEKNDEIKNLNDSNNIFIKENDDSEIIYTGTNNQIASINTVDNITTINNSGMMEKSEY